MSSLTTLMPLLIPLTAIVVSLLIVAVTLYFRHQNNLLKHETLRRLAEQGVPLTPEVLATIGKTEDGKEKIKGPDDTLKKGMTILWSGVGVMVGLYLISPRAPWGLGAMLAFMGLGYLITWKIDRRKPE